MYSDSTYSDIPHLLRCGAVWGRPALGLDLGEAGDCTSHPVGGGLGQDFRPDIHGLDGLVAHGLLRLSGCSAQEFDCSFFIHAAIVNLVYDL